MLLESLCLSAASAVMVIEVYSEGNKPVLLFQFEGNWASSLPSQSYTVSDERALILTISCIETLRQNGTTTLCFATRVGVEGKCAHDSAAIAPC